jgi:hypothetical protein
MIELCTSVGVGNRKGFPTRKNIVLPAIFEVVSNNDISVSSHLQIMSTLHSTTAAVARIACSPCRDGYLVMTVKHAVMDEQVRGKLDTWLNFHEKYT